MPSAAETRQRRSAEDLAPRIAQAVDALLEARDGYLVPEDGMWREALPNALLPRPLAELRPMLLEAHYAMEPRRQRQWLARLRTTGFVLRVPGDLGPARRPGEATAALVLVPVPAQVPDLEGMSDEDAAALEGL
ncbi:hypothetical protein OKC48_07240 [Methylorubrum extorquens]|uniref:hypothetical protein n=1 Tax=Methylorubrum extorquens TaxID=408 RepID=UPI0022371892|nr:hypothetical protein [Methylorubrum extorquens]UYW28301.1 hypothetical protein OKC48_07240 [Methylorubrum extorquens]